MPATHPERSAVFLPFLNRRAGGEALAAQLAIHAGRRALVLGLPRGGIAVARAVAERLAADLDVLLLAKLRGESAGDGTLGVVDETGWLRFAPGVPVDEHQRRHLVHEITLQRAVLADRARHYRAGAARADASGRTVIVVDEGMATGATMAAALHAVRSRAPQRLVCAVPVASREALRALEACADELACVAAPLRFDSIARYYRDFRAVDDAQVAALLQFGPSARTA